MQKKIEEKKALSNIFVIASVYYSCCQHILTINIQANDLFYVVISFSWAGLQEEAAVPLL